jgi:AcrR family transcriptional regulator
MSPANVYRFFSAKAEINEAVGRRLLRAIEAAGEEIVKQPRPAGEKLRTFLAAVEKANDAFTPIANCMICLRRRSARTGRSRMTTSKK